MVALVVLIGTGCSSMPAALEALGKDHNNVTVQITTIYGSMKYARTGGDSTNTVTSVGTDGSITTKNP